MTPLPASLIERSVSPNMSRRDESMRRDGSETRRRNETMRQCDETRRKRNEHGSPAQST